MPDENGMVSTDEEKLWGVLGKPPMKLFTHCPKAIRKEWNDLQRDAKRVLRIRTREAREIAAKEIESRRRTLCSQIELYGE